MSNGIPDDFNGYILPDGQYVSIEDADTMYREIIAKEKDKEKVRAILHGLIKECLDVGLLNAAFSYLEKELSITDDKKRLVRIHLTIGTVFEKMQDYQAAAMWYSAAFELPQEKNQPWYFLHNNLGYCLNQLGRYEEAEKLCQDAIDIDPIRHNAYKNLGLALQGQGKYPEAAALFLQAAFSFPPDPRSIRHLEELLLCHRDEIEQEIPDIDEQLAAAIDAHQKLIQ